MLFSLCRRVYCKARVNQRHHYDQLLGETIPLNVHLKTVAVSPPDSIDPLDSLRFGVLFLGGGKQS